MAERRRLRRAKLIELAGGKCIRCGSTERLDLDHRDSSTKEKTLSGKGIDGPWSAILEELKKCDLLCRPCHIKKTKECGDGPDQPWNKGIDKNGDPIPEHGHESRYVQGCRCELCREARRNVRIVRGETSGIRRPYRTKYSIGFTAHGTVGGYRKELRNGMRPCELCRKANCAYTANRRLNVGRYSRGSRDLPVKQEG